MSVRVRVCVCVCVGRKYMLVFQVEATDAPLGEENSSGCENSPRTAGRCESKRLNCYPTLMTSRCAKPSKHTDIHFWFYEAVRLYNIFEQALNSHSKLPRWPVKMKFVIGVICN